MPVYLYECADCYEVIEEVQGVNDKHVAYCPKCSQPAKRIFTAPQVKKSSGFYSDALGCEVSSQKDLEEKQEKWRYKQGLNKFLGNNYTPKDEWVEEKTREDTRQKQDVLQKEEERASLYPEYYDSVTIYE